MENQTRKAPTMKDVMAARDVLSDKILATPLLYSPLFTEKYGFSLYLKADSLTETGSFKIRGAMYALHCLTAQQRQRGVVAFSTGNHAQAVAYAAKKMQIKAVIIMPQSAPQVKIENTRAYGAQVLLFDPQQQAREEIAQAYVEQQAMTLIHPYDDANVITGQGVAGLECAEQLRNMQISPDAFFLPVSGGGYLSGFSISTEHFFPDAQLIAVEPEATAAWSKSLASGQAVTALATATSICDAIMPPVPKPGNLPWQMLQQQISAIHTIDDSNVLLAMAAILKYFGLSTEPSGAATVAAILASSEQWQGKTLLATLSGRNVNVALTATALELIDQV
ncbi:MAG: threonine/serine dehydratase [Oceanospirillaceae bacterium]|nr:threonine/serine dehydratase [Oceanospirillaceae bacterium]